MRVKFDVTFEVHDYVIFTDSKILELGAVKVGSLSLNGGLCLPYAGVSRLHAVVDHDEATGKVSVIDLSSREGTFVGDEKINKKVLKSGDVVRFGSSVKVIVTFPAPVEVEYIPPAGHR